MKAIHFDKEGLLSAKEAEAVIESIGRIYPEAKAELDYETDFQLLIAVILSAQTTDIQVNKATPGLFSAFPDPQSMARASLAEIEDKISTIGLYRNKAKFLKKTSIELLERFAGQVPQTHEELMSLPGVGRKTANVVMSVAFNEPSIAVDTHVNRVSKRLKMVDSDASLLEVEETLKAKLPKDLWNIAHHRLIFFGRYQCTARTHNHQECLSLIQQHLK